MQKKLIELLAKLDLQKPPVALANQILSILVKKSTEVSWDLLAQLVTLILQENEILHKKLTQVDRTAVKDNKTYSNKLIRIVIEALHNLLDTLEAQDQDTLESLLKQLGMKDPSELKDLIIILD